MTRDVFDLERLPPALDLHLREVNPWWEGKPGRVLPQYRRWCFDLLLRKLDQGLAPALILRGPRQVGKTTLHEQAIEHLIREKNVRPNRVFRVQFDQLSALLQDLDLPLLTLAYWFENRVLGRTFNEAARAGEPAYLFLDEVQNLPEWAPQLKSLVDHHTAHVVVTGSSALRIEAGRDSLAGRVTTIELGTLLLREIAGLRFGEEWHPPLGENRLELLTQRGFWEDLRALGSRRAPLRDRAFAAFSERGGYPIAQARPEVGWEEVGDQLNETVVQRAIQHDLRIGRKGQKRDPQLLEEVFRLACRYTGQAPGRAVFVPEIRQALGANVGWNRILSYLSWLDGALLLRLIRPLEIRLKRRKGNAKICLCDPALRAAWLQEHIPLDPGALAEAPHLADLAGRIAEGVVGYFLANLVHLDVAHFPERGVEPEVDYVLTIGDRRIPLEVKYRRRIDAHRDTLGLRAFIEKTIYGAPFGILVAMDETVSLPDPRIVVLSLPTLLMMR